jgi:periplasmic protein CpxP/Spy
MSKIKLLTIAVIGLLVVNIGVVGFLLLKKPPMPPKAGPAAKREDPKNIIIDKLHFDKDQVAAYETLITAHRESVKALNDNISNTRNRLYQSLKTETFTGKDSLITLLSVLQKQMEYVHYEHFTQIKKLCKPEQINDFNALTSELAFHFSTEKKANLSPSNK